MKKQNNAAFTEELLNMMSVVYKEARKMSGQLEMSIKDRDAYYDDLPR